MTKPAGWSAAAAAPDRALPAGTRVDDYEIEQTLAEGGVAIVYRAFDHALGLQVALEEYMPEAMALRSADGRVVLRTRVQGHAFEEGRQAFVGEAQTLARCAHPALLRIDRVLQRNGTVYRAMRLCTGPTLLEHRRTLAARPDAGTLQRWLEDLLGALEALHAEGCVHGALAPSRILVRDGGHLLLLGFDAVRTKLISGRTQDMMAALEPSFAAPELRNPSPGQASGPWTDLYALATTLRYCIDGELPPPAAGLATARTGGLVSAAWRRAAREGGGETDVAWLGAIDACLAEAPQDRPQSVARLRRMIDEALFASTLPAWPAPRIAPTPSDAVGAAAVTKDSAEGTAVQFAADADPLPRPEAASEPEPAAPAPAAPAPAADETAPADTQGSAEPRPGGHSEPAPEAASAPINSPVLADAAIAHMLADLDQTFARVAAMAGEESDPQRPTPAFAPAASDAAGSEAGAESASAKPPAPWRRELPAQWQRELRALWQRGRAMWLRARPVPAAAPAASEAPGGEPGAAPGREADAEFAPAGKPPRQWRRELRALWQRRPAVWLGVAVVGVAAVALLLGQGERAPDGHASSDAAPIELAAPPPPALPMKLQAPPPRGTGATQSETSGQLAPETAAADVEPVAPATPLAATAQKPVPAARPRPAPRAACTGKSGYALYQCMQTQCAKPSYAKHPQCVRLRRTQSLN